jgi:hypothetical protein
MRLGTSGSRQTAGACEAHGIDGTRRARRTRHEHADSGTIEHPTSGGSSSLARLRLSMIVSVATVKGLARCRAYWAVGHIGESAHPGQRVSAEDG